MTFNGILVDRNTYPEQAICQRCGAQQYTGNEVESVDAIDSFVRCNNYKKLKVLTTRCTGSSGITAT